MGFWMFFGIDTPFDPKFTIVTSNVFSSLILGLFRLVIAIYTLTAVLTIVFWDRFKEHDLKTFLTYFTNLTYIGLTSYFWISSFHTLAFAYRLRTKGTKPVTYPLQNWPKIFQLLHVFLTCTIYVFPFIVTIVFWTLLADGAFDSTWSTWKNISVHALNSAFAVTEILLSRVNPRWSNIPILIVVLGCYLGVAYITHATQGYYPYSFLNPANGKGKLAGYIVGIPVAAIVILAIIKGVCWLRDKALGGIWPQPTGAADDEYKLNEKVTSHV